MLSIIQSRFALPLSCRARTDEERRPRERIAVLLPALHPPAPRASTNGFISFSRAIPPESFGIPSSRNLDRSGFYLDATACTVRGARASSFRATTLAMRGSPSALIGRLGLVPRSVKGLGEPETFRAVRMQTRIEDEPSAAALAQCTLCALAASASPRPAAKASPRPAWAAGLAPGASAPTGRLPGTRLSAGGSGSWAATVPVAGGSSAARCSRARVSAAPRTRGARSPAGACQRTAARRRRTF